MIKRLCTLVVLVAAAGALVAGCGGSSSSSSSAAPPATTSSASSAGTATASSSTATGGGSTAGGDIANNPAVKAAVAQCKASINAAPTLSADAKTKLDGLCDKAASGNLTELRKASAEVCQEIVKETVPQAGQDAALAACPKP